MKKHTLNENLISALIGITLAIPLCICAYSSSNNQNTTVGVESATEVTTEQVTQLKSNEMITVAATEKETEPTGAIQRIEKVALGEFRVTAYCPCSECCGQWADGITYTGVTAKENRTIAVDPNVIPLGSIVEVDGMRFVAEDIGGAIKGNRLDIYFDSHQHALNWGVQSKEIYLIVEN